MPQYLNSLEKLKICLAASALFLLPVKLSLCYVALLPLLSIWTIENFKKLKLEFISPKNLLLWPLVVFVLVGSISALVGVRTAPSVWGLINLFFLSLLVPALTEAGAKLGFLKLLVPLLAGQTVAAFHSMLEDPFSLKNVFLGKVTESGQLALTWLVAFGLVLELKTKFNSARSSNQIIFFGLCNLLIFTLLTFSPHISASMTLKTVLLSGSIALIALSLFRIYKLSLSKQIQKSFVWFSSLSLVVLPLLSTALLANLKRGPWAGVFAGTLVLLAYSSRKLLGLVIVFALALVLLVEPIRTRIQEAPRDFFISGGRATIWEIGVELATRYPLGIGFDNSVFLRNYSTQIPKENRHFHSNFLNILVETGILGLLIFLWWIYVLLKVAWSSSTLPPGKNRRPFKVALGAAILSWQIAGSVEYNFGDTEVLLVVFAVIAFLSNATRISAELDKLSEPQS